MRRSSLFDRFARHAARLAGHPLASAGAAPIIPANAAHGEIRADVRETGSPRVEGPRSGRRE